MKKSVIENPILNELVENFVKLVSVHDSIASIAANTVDKDDYALLAIVKKLTQESASTLELTLTKHDIRIVDGEVWNKVGKIVDEPGIPYGSDYDIDAERIANDTDNQKPND